MDQETYDARLDAVIAATGFSASNYAYDTRKHVSATFRAIDERRHEQPRYVVILPALPRPANKPARFAVAANDFELVTVLIHTGSDVYDLYADDYLNTVQFELRFLVNIRN